MGRATAAINEAITACGYFFFALLLYNAVGVHPNTIL